MGNRIPLVAANWKMNFDSGESVSFARQFLTLVGKSEGVEVAVCAPFTALHALHGVFSGTIVKLGAQNVFFEESGTFTGEISAKMLVPYCSFVIVGHSERRSIFHETNSDVNRKAKKVLEHGMAPIVCVGESLEERTTGKTNAVLEKMLVECFEGFSPEQAAKCVVAYEPVWAISRGKADIAKSVAATPETAQEAHAFIRSVLARLFGNGIAAEIRIIYGGSMKPDNVKQLLHQKDIDGGLVGGASLDPVSFSKVVNFKGG